MIMTIAIGCLVVAGLAAAVAYLPNVKVAKTGASATWQELDAEFPDDPAFVVQCLRDGVDLLGAYRRKVGKNV